MLVIFSLSCFQELMFNCLLLESVFWICALDPLFIAVPVASGPMCCTLLARQAEGGRGGQWGVWLSCGCGQVNVTGTGHESFLWRVHSARGFFSLPIQKWNSRLKPFTFQGRQVSLYLLVLLVLFVHLLFKRLQLAASSARRYVEDMDFFNFGVLVSPRASQPPSQPPARLHQFTGSLHSIAYRIEAIKKKCMHEWMNETGYSTTKRWLARKGGQIICCLLGL